MATAKSSELFSKIGKKPISILRNLQFQQNDLSDVILNTNNKIIP
jgi:hypothetical protein